MTGVSAAERLAEALNSTVSEYGWLRSTPADPVQEWIANADHILSADPGLAEAIELGLAWQEAQAALPQSFFGLWLAPGWEGGWYASTFDRTHQSAVGEHGATATDALRALTMKLVGGV